MIVKDVEIAIDAVLSAMTASLINGQRIEIRGFGSFKINWRPARMARNPMSGKPVAVPEKYIPHFRPGRELRERVDR